jgi:DNA-binding Lrp family transcriptional regulator
MRSFLPASLCYAAAENASRGAAMRAVFVMVKVEPGQVDWVAQKIGDLEAFSEGYSISGAYDLLMKFYIEDIDHLGRLVNQQIQAIPHVRETFSILTFNAFPAPEG